jgi:hypothetical protein
LPAGQPFKSLLVFNQSAFSKVTEHNDQVKIGRLFEQVDLGFGFEKKLAQKTIVTFLLFQLLILNH